MVRAAWNGAEIPRLEFVPVRQDHRSLDRVLQLAHVAAPLLLLEPGDGRVAQRQRPAEALRQPRDEVARQGRDVFAPLGQWWLLERSQTHPRTQSSLDSNRCT